MTRVADIVTIAADLAAVDPTMLLGGSHLKRVVRVRYACMTVAKEVGHSYSGIGRRMNRHHSTVMHGVEKAAIIAERDAGYAAFLDRLRTISLIAKPGVADRVILRLTPEPKPEPVEADLSDDELLSRAVAAHYAGVGA